MLKRNHTLLVFIIMTCIVSSFVHGMKRNADIEYSLENCVLPANGELLPQEILEQIFTCLCENLINTPLFVQKSKQTIFNFNRYFSGNSQWRITPNGNIAYLATIRSVCKQWYGLLNPAEIKRRLHIHIDDIVHDLSIISVTGNQQNRSHAQFLAQMIKGQVIDACNNLLPKIIREDDDSDKLQILLENGLIDPNRYLKKKDLVFPSPLGCCLVKRIGSWGENEVCVYEYFDCHEKSFQILLNYGANVHQEYRYEYQTNKNIVDFLLSYSCTFSSVKPIIKLIEEKIPFNMEYQNKILERSTVRNIDDCNADEVCCFNCSLFSALSIICLMILVGNIYNGFQ